MSAINSEIIVVPVPETPGTVSFKLPETGGTLVGAKVVNGTLRLEFKHKPSESVELYTCQIADPGKIDPATGKYGVKTGRYYVQVECGPEFYATLRSLMYQGFMASQKHSRRFYEVHRVMCRELDVSNVAGEQFEVVGRQT